MAFFQQSGGAINEVPADTTAFPHRYANSNLITGSFWPYGVDTAPHIEWSRRYWRKVDKFTKGFYTVDEFSESQQQVNKNFLGNYDRLVKIKNQYDPTNLFRLNANIKPTITAG
jgi:FAD/FMN-containing dehydrogenase